MARKATSLGPKPSLFVFVFVLFLFLLLFFPFFGFFLPPHLALNPPYLFFWLFLIGCIFPLSFLFVFNKKPCFPPKKGIFCLFLSVSLSFFLGLFWPPPFPLSFSQPLSFSLLSSFLLAFFFAFFWFLVFVSFFIFVSFSLQAQVTLSLICIGLPLLRQARTAKQNAPSVMQ